MNEQEPEKTESEHGFFTLTRVSPVLLRVGFGYGRVRSWWWAWRINRKAKRHG